MKERRMSLSCLNFALAVAIAVSGTMPAYSQQNKDPEAFYRAPGSLHGKTVLLPIGTTLEGRIEGTIGSSASKQGQKFSILMAAPVLANGTDVVIPSGSLIIGEVVEAIPSGNIPKQKGYPKPTGKLRVQLSGLRTPDGVNYPLVASLAGDTFSQGNRQVRNERLGGGVGYAGTEAGFAAVAPGMTERSRRSPGQAPQVVNRQELMRDAIYGLDPMEQRGANNKPTIRSLQKRGRDIYILDGSPVSVRIDAPFKIGVAAAPGAESNYLPILDPEGTGTGRRFQPAASAAPPPAAPVEPKEQPFQLPTPASSSIFPVAPVNQPAPVASQGSPSGPPPALPPQSVIPQAPAAPQAVQFQQSQTQQVAPGTAF